MPKRVRRLCVGLLNNKQSIEQIPGTIVTAREGLAAWTLYGQCFRLFSKFSANEIYFTGFGNVHASVQLFNCTGTLVLASERYTSSSPLSIGELEPGMYTYRVHTSTGTFRGKIVKD